MNTQTALQTLIQAVQIATKRGAFELAETKILLEAIEVFTKAPETAPEAPTDEKTEETTDTK